MSHSRSRQLSLQVWPALWFAGLTACATGVQQEFLDDETSSSTSENTGGALNVPSEAGTTSVVPKAGSTGTGGASSPFGGAASTGGKETAGSGGMDVGEGGADSERGGSTSGGASAGSGGASAGSGGASAGSGGSGSGPCGCGKTLAWADNTVLNWVTGDCLTVAATTTYKYTGTKAQTYANGQCNPGKQEPWCTDSGNDYKFMVCP